MAGEKKKSHPAGMPGWIDIGSDVSWDEYGGRWARRANDGSFYIIEFTNMYEACGESDCKRDGQSQYVCEVKRVDLTDLSDDKIKSALDCVGLTRTGGRIYSNGEEIADDSEDERRYQIVLVEACVSYGYAQPLDTFSGNVRASNVRAQARRAAGALMRDAAKLETALERPVNKIGSTAREYGRGDVNAALFRGPVDTTKSIILKMHGATEEDIASLKKVQG